MVLNSNAFNWDIVLWILSMCTSLHGHWNLWSVVSARLFVRLESQHTSRIRNELLNKQSAAKKCSSESGVDSTEQSSDQVLTERSGRA